jgi:hypothetical protein
VVLIPLRYRFGLLDHHFSESVRWLEKVKAGGLYVP